MATTATIHNPTNFEPSDYEVVDYLDNKRPQLIPGQRIEEYREEVEAWERANEFALGPDWRAKLHRCVHCGNGSVRWITAVEHLPTKQRVVFGAVCTQRLGFKDRFTFKLAQLQARDEARKVRFVIYQKRQAYIEMHPEIAQALIDSAKPEHAKNTFVQDVLRKLDQYGDLTEKQAAAVVASLARDLEHAARQAAEQGEVKGEAPVGRVDLSCVVLTMKVQEGQFGDTYKMLVKFENNSRGWVTVPREISDTVERGDKLTLRATWEQSRDDKSFAFGKRPMLIERIPAAEEVKQS